MEKFFIFVFLLGGQLCGFAQSEASALSLFKMGEYDKAAKMYGMLYAENGSTRFLDMAKKAQECIVNRRKGHIAIDHGEYAEAVQCFNKLLALNPHDARIAEKLNEIKHWVDNDYLKGSLIFPKGDGLFLAVQPIQESQKKCNREEARDESVKCRQGGLTDWRIPSMDEMKIILREIPENQLQGDVFWFGDFDRVMRIMRNPRTQEIVSQSYVSYSATCMDKTGRLIRIDNPEFRANYFLVRDFSNDCIPCPVTMYEETR